MIKKIKSLPSYENLLKGEIEQTDLQKLLETEPAKEWLKDHPTAKNEKGEAVQYLPIERIDFLLRGIYAGHWLEVIDTNLTQFSIQITVRLFVVNPETGRVEHSDGVGGAGSKNGIEAAVPIAESLAKKNAAKKLGKIFGRDVSRELDGEMEPKKQTEKSEEVKTEEPENPVKKRLILQIQKTKTAEGLKKVIAAFKVRYEAGQVDNSEFEEVNEEIQKTAKRLKIKI
jgi:hypothetical protein